MFWHSLCFVGFVAACLLATAANGAIIEAPGCSHNGTLYADGSFVPTLEPCLSCRCSTKTLICSLKVCPEIPVPPPRGCVVVQKKTSCCPYLSCARLDAFVYNGPNRKIITYLDHFERESIDRVVNENVLQRRSDDSEIDTYGEICVKNGTVYKSGSAMSSSGLCTYCYCIGGSQKCVKPKCIMPMDGCKPIFVDSTCCPVRYDCTAKSTGKSSLQNRIRKTSNKHYQRMSQRLQRNRGCTVNDQFYPEGQKMPFDADKPCDICFCIRGTRKCAPKKCAPALKNCIPVVPKGQCCPSSYDCGNHSIRDRESGRLYNKSPRQRQFNLFSFIFGPEEEADDDDDGTGDKNGTEPVKREDKMAATANQTLMPASLGVSSDDHVDAVSASQNQTIPSDGDRDHPQEGPNGTAQEDHNDKDLSFLDILLQTKGPAIGSQISYGDDGDDDDDDQSDEKTEDYEDINLIDLLLGKDEPQTTAAAAAANDTSDEDVTTIETQRHDDDVTVTDDNFSAEFSGDGMLDTDTVMSTTYYPLMDEDESTTDSATTTAMPDETTTVDFTTELSAQSDGTEAAEDVNVEVSTVFEESTPTESTTSPDVTTIDANLKEDLTTTMIPSLNTTTQPEEQKNSSTTTTSPVNTTEDTSEDFLSVLFDGLSTIFNDNETESISSSMATTTTTASSGGVQVTPAPTEKTIQIRTNPTILDADMPLDYNEPTLPPSLPNLKIIPFLPADAVKTDRKQAIYDFKKSPKYPSITERNPVWHAKNPISKMDYDPSEDFNYDDYSVIEDDEYIDQYLQTKYHMAEPKNDPFSVAFVPEKVEASGFSPPTKTEGGFVPKPPSNENAVFGNFPETKFVGPVTTATPPLTQHPENVADVIDVAKTDPPPAVNLSIEKNETPIGIGPLTAISESGSDIDVDSIHITTDATYIFTSDYTDASQANSSGFFESHPKEPTPFHPAVQNSTSAEHEDEFDYDSVFDFFLRPKKSTSPAPVTIPPFKNLPPEVMNASLVEFSTPASLSTTEQTFDDLHALKDLLSPSYEYPDSKIYQKTPMRPQVHTITPITTTPNPFLFAPFNKLPFLDHSFPVKAQDSQDEISDRIDDDLNLFLTDFKPQGSPYNVANYHVMSDDLALTHTESYVVNPVDIDKLKEHQSSGAAEIFTKTQSSNSLMDPAGILKLAGCNIYGRMYRVGRIISELSGPCIECKCTEVGVNCSPLDC